MIERGALPKSASVPNLSFAPASGSKNFLTDLQTLRDKAFLHNMVHISWITASDFPENFTTNVTLNKEVPATFGKSSGARVHIYALLVLLLPPPRRLYNARCLSGCLLATLRKNYWIDLHENFYDRCIWSRKNWLNFGSHPPPHADPGLFWRILQHL